GGGHDPITGAPAASTPEPRTETGVDFKPEPKQGGGGVTGYHVHAVNHVRARQNYPTRTKHAVPSRRARSRRDRPRAKPHPPTRQGRSSFPCQRGNAEPQASRQRTP